MAKRSVDLLFQLIRSLEKGEKRHFKLFIRRSSSNENLKVIQLFDALDKLDEYDEARLLRKLPTVQKAQLPNLKAHLYRQLLASLRLLKSADSIDLQLNEHFDYAHILYKKGLFLQSLKLLQKAKELATANEKQTFLIQALSLEKRIEALHITRSMQDRAEVLSAETLRVSNHISHVARLSNLALKLYSWYIRNGHTRNRADEEEVRRFLQEQLPSDAWSQQGFYERLYLYQSLSWYAYIRQDFPLYYRHTSSWVSLFEKQPLMKRVETGHYIKGLHNLLNAHFDLRRNDRLLQTLKTLETFSRTERVEQNDNFRVQCFLYIAQARINSHFLRATFREGLSLIPGIEQGIKENSLFIDPHRQMVFNYKIASLYFGSGDFSTSIDYLQPILHQNTGLRYDLQCYARLLHLLAHYELGNYELVDYLSQSVYRFMARMKNLTQLEEEILSFLRRSFRLSPDRIREELRLFLQRIKKFEKNRFQARVFVYLDIVSWVESKVHGRTLSAVMQEKFLKGQKEPLS
jgi:tetratricopeptide (TPR) repeat protein